MANRIMQPQFSEHERCRRKYLSCRTNLLLVVAFTVINLVLLVTNSDTYFLFSAFIPYFFADLGMLMCGRYPAAYYEGELEGMIFLDNSFFYAMLAIAVVLTLLYVLAWFMSSRNRVGWMIFALVFFGLDTLGMILLGGIALETAMNLVFHVAVLYYLIAGVVAHYKLKSLPPEENATASAGFPSDPTENG
jgi:hypothetical protein